MEALKQAGNWVKERDIVNHKIDTYTDSKTSLYKLQKETAKSSQTITTINILNMAAKTNKLTLYKINAYCGIHGNEEADTLAKQATETIIQGPEPFLPFNNSHINKQLKERTLKKCIESINSHKMTEGNKQYLLQFFKKHITTIALPGPTRKT